MKSIALAAAALLLFAATASAGEMAVSTSTLDTMGLGSMQQLSDDEGQEVRGKGLFENWFAGTIEHIAGTSIQLGEQLGGLGDTFGGLGDTFGSHFGNLIDFNFGNFNFDF